MFIKSISIFLAISFSHLDFRNLGVIDMSNLRKLLFHKPTCLITGIIFLIVFIPDPSRIHTWQKHLKCHLSSEPLLLIPQASVFVNKWPSKVFLEPGNSCFIGPREEAHSRIEDPLRTKLSQGLPHHIYH